MPATTPTTALTIDLPQTFYDDHTSRDLPAPAIEKRLARTYRCSGSLAEWGELLSDAHHYATDASLSHDPELRGLSNSAKATAARIRAALEEAGLSEEQAIAASTAAEEPEEDRPLIEQPEGTRSDGRSLPRRINLGLTDLLDAGLIEPGAELTYKLRGHAEERRARINPDGTIRYAGENYASPSAAGLAARLELIPEATGSNGWEEWKLPQGEESKLRPLGRLRDQLLDQLQAQA